MLKYSSQEKKCYTFAFVHTDVRTYTSPDPCESDSRGGFGFTLTPPQMMPAALSTESLTTPLFREALTWGWLCLWLPS